MKNILLDSKNRTVRFLKPGVEINFGSIGKGYALDQAAERTRTTGIRNALLHGGHSSVCAIGTGPERGRGWPVGIRHPWKPDQRLATVRLKDRALGTSAATFQHLEHAGRKLGHILDPRTYWPAESMASASVVAPTAALADALATAFFILGVDKARLYCENHPEIAAVLLPAEESAQPVVVGLRDDLIQLASADPTCQAT
jgi:thiamine biosynthesis lipoprotein